MNTRKDHMEHIVDDIMVTEVCKLGQGADTCRFLIRGATWECAKLTSMRVTIDARVAEGSFTAIGDNCNGI